MNTLCWRCSLNVVEWPRFSRVMTLAVAGNAVVVPLCGTSVGAGMVPALCMQSVCMGRQWKVDDISSSTVVVVQDQPLDGWEDLKVAAVASGTGTRFC